MSARGSSPQTWCNRASSARHRVGPGDPGASCGRISRPLGVELGCIANVGHRAGHGQPDAQPAPAPRGHHQRGDRGAERSRRCYPCCGGVDRDWVASGWTWITHLRGRSRGHATPFGRLSWPPRPGEVCLPPSCPEPRGLRHKFQLCSDAGSNWAFDAFDVHPLAVAHDACQPLATAPGI